MDIKVSTPAISGGAQAFSAVANELLDQIGRVGREIESLRGEWSGPAALQFDSLMGEWNRDAQDITNVLNQVVDRLNKAHAGYEEVESSIRNSFGQ